MGFRWSVAVALLAAGIMVAVVVRDREPERSEYCVAEVGEVRAEVDLEQARWTSLMAAIAHRRGLSPRATTIAIATAYQESKIHNIDYGDRDSVGLFQQRPSQGWGTVEEIMEPTYSIGAFYDALEQVDGYETLEITDAAQRVQRSAFPTAYADHEDDARALASSLRGYSPTQFHCVLNDRAPGNVSAAADEVGAAFGTEATTERDRLTIPLVGDAPDVNARGWAVAHYLVANAARLGISEVAFDRHVWTVSDSDTGWARDAGAAADTVVASTT